MLYNIQYLYIYCMRKNLKGCLNLNESKFVTVHIFDEKGNEAVLRQEGDSFTVEVKGEDMDEFERDNLILTLGVFVGGGYRALKEMK